MFFNFKKLKKKLFINVFIKSLDIKIYYSVDKCFKISFNYGILVYHIKTPVEDFRSIKILITPLSNV